MVKDAYNMLLDSPLLLSRNFSLKELLKSDTAILKGIDNSPHTFKRFSVVLDNLFKLASILELIRAAQGNKPLYVTSGFRSVQLNNEVKGVYDSKHLYGAAADITAKDFDNLVDAVDFLYFESKDVYFEVHREERYIHIHLKQFKKDGIKKCKNS